MLSNFSMATDVGKRKLWILISCTPDYLGERAFFFSICGRFFWQFFPSNATILLYNIRYWWFFLSQPCFICCHILMQNFFMLRWNSCKQHSGSSVHCCFWSAVSKHSTHFEHIFINDIPAKWWLHCLLISLTLLLSHATLNYDRPKRVCWDFCATWAFSNICVSIPLLNRCFRLSRVRITVTKPLLGLNSIFAIRKQCFINTRNP